MRVYLRSQLWVAPALCIVGALLLSQIVPIVDTAAVSLVPGRFNVNSSRAALSAVAGGMMAFTSFVFAITLLQLQFGSSALSPRIARLLRRDRATKAALGTFTATFVYSLAALLQVGSRGDTYVPADTAVCCVLLLLLSLIAFLALLQHAGDRNRVGGALEALARAGRRAIQEMHPALLGDDGWDLADEGAPEPDAAAVRLLHQKKWSGSLAAVDLEGATRLAGRMGATVWLLPRLGDFVSDGAPVLLIQGPRPAADGRFRRMLTFRDEPMVDQDPSFAIRLLVDIGVKGLASGDPGTAVQAIDRLEELLGRLASRSLGWGHLTDKAGETRVYYRTPTWEDYVQLAVEELRVHGSGSPQVLRRLRAVLNDLGGRVTPTRLPALQGALRRLDETVELLFITEAGRALAGIPDRQGFGAGSLTSEARDQL